MITLYQVKHVSSELAKDVCLSFSVGIFGFVSSAHTAANNWRAHSHRCCFKLQNLKRHYFSSNWWHIVEFRWYQFTGSSSEKRSGSWDHFPQFLWFAAQSHSSVFRHFRSNIFDGCPWPTLCCFEHRRRQTYRSSFYHYHKIWNFLALLSTHNHHQCCTTMYTTSSLRDLYMLETNSLTRSEAQKRMTETICISPK